MYPADWKDLNRDAKCWDIETDDVRMQKSEVTNSPSPPPPMEGHSKDR